MTSKDIPAGAWFRVSTADQREASQVPDVERHCRDRGYVITRRYELNDLSAWKGEQQAKLDQMLEDMREGIISVCVCWWSDRIERRGPEAVFKLLRQVKDAGGRLESVHEPLFGTEDVSGETMTAISAITARQESAKKSERQKISITGLKASGSIYNNVGWGLDIVGDKYYKKVVPTDLCGEIAPRIFQACIDGYSLRQIAEGLDRMHVRPKHYGKKIKNKKTGKVRTVEKWNESAVRWIIHDRAYAGTVQTRTGVKIATCEAVISPSTFEKANQALKRRPPRGAAKAGALLVSLKCARCGSSMNRIKHGYKNKYVSYRCTGNGPQRKGCGNMVPLAQTDIIIATEIFMTDTKPHKIRQWVEGESWDNQISDTRADMHEAIDSGRFSGLPALQAKLEEFQRLNEGATAGHYEYTDTKQTEGDYFDSLDLDGQRAYLKTRDIRVEKVENPPLEPGASVGLHVIIDGIDRGIWPYPPNL